jgi:hypothetical protein
LNPQDDWASIARRLSKNELLRLNLYLQNSNIRAVIVGGWAVYAYNPYMESIDIDIVVRHKDVHKVTTLAQEKCGWIPDTELRDETFSRYAKRINHGEKIILDIISSNFENRFHEDRTKLIPYNLCLKNGWHHQKFIDNIFLYVPIKELLFLYKLKAHRDRIYRYRKEKDEKEKMKLQAKLIKDLSDAISLIDPNFGILDIEILKKLVDTYNLHFLSETLTTIHFQNEAIRQYRNSSPNDIKNWTAKIRKAFIHS